MIARYAPIAITEPDLRKRGPLKPPPVLQFERLEAAPVQPDHAAMDDTAEWMHNGGRELLEGMLVVECPEASHG